MNKSGRKIRKADLGSDEVQAWMLKEAKKVTYTDAEEVRQEANIKILKSPRSEFPEDFIRTVIRNCYKTILLNRKRDARLTTAFGQLLGSRILKPKVVEKLEYREILAKIARLAHCLPSVKNRCSFCMSSTNCLIKRSLIFLAFLLSIRKYYCIEQDADYWKKLAWLISLE